AVHVTGVTPMEKGEPVSGLHATVTAPAQQMLVAMGWVKVTTLPESSSHSRVMLPGQLMIVGGLVHGGLHLPAEPATKMSVIAWPKIALVKNSTSSIQPLKNSCGLL